MDFEFDPRKSASNASKHGIDFVEAQRLWADAALLEIPARTEDEPRWLAIGRIDGRHWSGSIHAARRGSAHDLCSTGKARGSEVV
jgi:uncharacterized protein